MLVLYRRLIRWAFTRFYREFAWTYDGVAWLVSAGFWRSWVLSAVPALQGRILELGFGSGHAQLALAAQGRLAVGLDASPQMNARTAQRLLRAGHVPYLCRGVAQQLPFADMSFDSVLVTFPAEYILDAATAAEVRRVLAPGGQLVVVDGAQFTRNGAYERLSDLAFRATLQSSVRTTDVVLPYLSNFVTAGFRFTACWHSVGPSRVMVVQGYVARY
jgi:ubiquinone/menaquinone biosynthesis C-methylase UbiE